MAVGISYAQSGSTFKEFSAKLQPYYDEEFIDDIFKAMPKGSDFKIWSWDIGDFSGDGNNDVALVVKSAGEKRRIAFVYLFVDIKGYLTNINTYQYAFIDMPLEIGVVIKKNVCFITQKKEQFSWQVRGYTFENGSIILADDFSTSRIGAYTKESYRNYRSLESKERLIETSSDNIPFDHKFLTVPAYSRNRQIFRGYAATAHVQDPDFVMQGAFFWKGLQDCSFEVPSIRYDNEYVYLTVNVTDDELVYGLCDTCTADKVDFWFHPKLPAGDINQYLETRIAKKHKREKKKVSNSDTGMVHISIHPGDFIDKAPSVLYESSDSNAINIQNIKVVSALNKNGYSLKVKIPLGMIGVDELSNDIHAMTELGFTVSIQDSDNKFRPEEETIIATSQLDEFKFSTYGSLLFIPDQHWYGETVNIYEESLFTTLHELGF